MNWSSGARECAHVCVRACVWVRGWCDCRHENHRASCSFARDNVGPTGLAVGVTVCKFSKRESSAALTRRHYVAPMPGLCEIGFSCRTTTAAAAAATSTTTRAAKDRDRSGTSNNGIVSPTAAAAAAASARARAHARAHRPSATSTTSPAEGARAGSGAEHQGMNWEKLHLLHRKSLLFKVSWLVCLV